MSKKKRVVYFGHDVQQAIIEFNEIDPAIQHKKDRLFKTIIYPAFLKLSENIINTWKFRHYDTTFVDLQLDVVSELYQKISGYNPEKGRAYSYFTIIAKNFLLKRSMQTYESNKNHNDLLLVDTERNLNSELSSNDHRENLSAFINIWCDWCENNLGKLFKKSRDQKIADAIIEIFRSRADIDIYNKKLLYILIRERGGIDTQYITRVLTYMKEIFYKKFDEYIKHGNITM